MKRINYKKVDAILKENPDINYQEFKKKCNTKISYASFFRRRQKITDKVDSPEPEVAVSLNPKAVVHSYAPNSNRKDELLELAKIIIADPNTSYISLKKEGKINFSDAVFYSLRRKIQGLNGKAVKKRSKPVPAPAKPRRQNGMFVNIFQKELNGKKLNAEAKELLSEFIDELNQQKLGNYQMVEVISPEHVLEVRSFARV